MKKVISIILSVVMIFTMLVPSFAAEKVSSDECGNYPVVLIRGMDFGGLYVDYGMESEQPALNVDAGSIVMDALGAIGKGIINFSFDKTVEEIGNIAAGIFRYMSMNKEGDSLYNVSVPKYPESADKYENLCEGTGFEYGMVRACIEEFGEGHTYYVNYDWRLDPYVVAEDINAAVTKAKETTGHDKVNIVCCSMGGLMTLAYLDKYGYESINKCLFMSSTFCGAQVASDLLLGKVKITADNLYGFVADLVKDNGALSVLIDVLYKIKVFNGLTAITDLFIDNYKEVLYEKAIIPVFGNILPLWGLVQKEDYEPALDYIFGGRENADPSFLARADALQSLMGKRTEMINSMIDDGVKIAVTAHYGKPVIPVYENAHFNGDGTLETYQMSGYATVAPYGKTLGEDYIAENPEYLSPDRCVDLSTALFPEYTYIIKGAPHVAGSYGTEYSEFFIWLLSYEGDEFYAGVNENYPQFMVSDANETLSAF